MKKTLTTFFSILLLLLTSCSQLGLYTTGQVKEASAKAQTRGVAIGRGIEARAQARREQQEREKPQSTPTFYNIPVAAHTSSDGTHFDAHSQTIRIQSN